MTENNYQHHLPIGAELADYRIEKILGEGGFGVTYLATDLNLGKQFAIKEYLPGDFAVRTENSTVVPKSQTEGENFKWGLDRFLDEARTLATFKHPNLNQVQRFFKANGTAYMVLEYIEGETLSDRLKREPIVTEPELHNLLECLIGGLAVVHNAGYTHRDIKPGNIMIQPDGTPVLLDFGAARQALGYKSKSITAILTPGYAPFEQYDTKAEDIGPWTDIYSLGMVAYQCVSGCKSSDLLEAPSRAKLHMKATLEKDLPSAESLGKGRYPEGLLKGIDWALKVQDHDRPQSVEEWGDVLFQGEMKTSGEKEDDQPKSIEPVTVQERPKKASTPQPKPSISGLKYVMIGVILIALVCGGFFALNGDDSPSESVPVVNSRSSESSSQKTAAKEAAAKEAKERLAAKQLKELAGEFVFVPGGCYQMGSNTGDVYGEPVHEVCLDNFSIGKFEVTQAQWQKVMGSNPSYHKGDDRPVETVSWEDVRDFIGNLNRKTGQSYRLPTEAEWEYAARSGGKAEKWAGTNSEGSLGDYAWYGKNSGSKTHPVGQKQPNGLGLYDMSGNVWEWCSDWYGEDYYGKSPRSNPLGPSAGSNRVERGGGWSGPAWGLQSAIRVGAAPGSLYSSLGFRVAFSAGS